MMQRPRKSLVVIVLALGLAPLAGCSIDAESVPREIPGRDQRDLRGDVNQSAGAATGSGRIFLLSPEVIGQSRTLQSVARDVGDSTTDVLNALFEGPNTEELQALLRSAIPPGTRLLSADQSNGVLVVNVSNELQQLTGEALVDGVAQIVLTASEITGVFAVTIAIDGVPQQWPAANGELQSEPLTPYDFPGLLMSSQPAFPAVPSPDVTTP